MNGFLIFYGFMAIVITGKIKILLKRDQKRDLGVYLFLALLTLAYASVYLANPYQLSFVEIVGKVLQNQGIEVSP